MYVFLKNTLFKNAFVVLCAVFGDESICNLTSSLYFSLLYTKGNNP